MTSWEFPCSEPAAINISSWPSGSVAVSGEDTPTITVDVEATKSGANADAALAEVRVDFEDGKLVITGPRLTGFRRSGLDLTIKTPARSNCQAHTASADISCLGQLGELDLHSASGDITIVKASGSVSVQTASGDVFIDEASADVTIKATSGDVRLSAAGGEVRANSVSGDLAIGRCGSPVTAHTVSGDAEVRELGAGRADFSTISGDVRVSILPGIGVYLDLATTSGSVRSDLDEGEEDEGGPAPQASLELKCRTISGDIHVAKAPADAAPSQSTTA
jgi:DUF4097 and DUF4098 domain-containing protein YvlB